MDPRAITHLWRRRAGAVFAGVLGAACLLTSATAADLEQGWRNPPGSARLRAYWWWLNGNVTKESITGDLEEMRAKGFGGALICDADGASQDGNERVPHGPDFFSPEWRELYKHTLKEANRLGLEMSLNIQSGWNLGGPMVTADDAAKKIVWSEISVTGPTNLQALLPVPKGRENYYRDWIVVAYSNAVPAAGPLLKNWEVKAIHRTLVPFSAPDSTPLFEELPETDGEAHTASAKVIDLTSQLDREGRLSWQVPAGQWQIIRFGCTIGDHSRVSTSSDGWKGYALDVLDAGAFNRYWDAVVEPLIEDAGPLAGKTLRYLHTDSWEVEAINWTPTLLQEFKNRRGYDLLPYAPALVGRVVDSRKVSNRFLNDFRKTIGELAIDNHFRIFRDRSRRHGLEFHPESGGPHAVPIDAQRCLGWNDAPMSEFWAWSWRHRVGDENRFFVKQPASAAHTYGRKLVLAEGFTTIGPHWQETLWDNLKPSFDKAICEGLNLLVWHAFVCSPKEMGIPGQQYFAGAHFNPNTTWWGKSEPFLSYINRIQFLMQQGLFVADVCYYYGDHVPNFARLKKSDPARILPGYDYDVITEEVLLTRAIVKDGRIVLPDGMSYRLLVLADKDVISLPVLLKIQELVHGGATVIGSKPSAPSSLRGFPRADEELGRVADALWGRVSRASNERKVGKGRIIPNLGARELLQRDGVPLDFDYKAESTAAALDYIHRRDRKADIYFVANRSNRAENAVCYFRVSGKKPELWNPVSGEIRLADNYEIREEVTSVPLTFTPCGSWIVVFRDATKQALRKAPEPTMTRLLEVTGPWTVQFDPRWGGPGSVQFDSLVNWTNRVEPGIRFYSGTALYRRSFVAKTPKPGARVWLDLGEVRELAEIRLNGKSLGITWAPPFRVDATAALHNGENQLEVEIVNFWPNRIIGDAALPAEERLTRTNIRKLTKDTPLMSSGLLGPVVLFLDAN